MRNSRSSSKHGGLNKFEGGESNPVGDSSEDDCARRPRRHRRPKERSYHDFKDDIPEFDGQLDLDLFLDWLQIAERVFELKDILEDKKVS